MSALLWLLLLVLASILLYQTVARLMWDKQNEHAHQTLLNRVKQLRFHKMLEFLGADVDAYLRHVPIADINRQIHRCSLCRTNDACDNHLRDGRRIDDMNFCPNHQSISANSKTLFGQRQL